MAKKAAAPKAAKAAAVKAPKTVRNCVCGCGTETTGFFMPGHDARVHGYYKKLADGRIGKNGKDTKTGEQVINPNLLKKLELKASGDGFKVINGDFYKQ